MYIQVESFLSAGQEFRLALVAPQDRLSEQQCKGRVSKPSCSALCFSFSSAKQHIHTNLDAYLTVKQADYQLSDV
jgi:hypothetical protein